MQENLQVNSIAVQGRSHPMNKDSDAVKQVLEKVRADYATGCQAGELMDPGLPITERDILCEIWARLRPFCISAGLHVHSEVKVAPSLDSHHTVLRSAKRVDVAILRDQPQARWLDAAREIQDRKCKGHIEARFEAIPVEYFHTVMEVKIQSHIPDARKDISSLSQIAAANPECNCFFVLLNARGQVCDHNAILTYAKTAGVPIVEYTARR